MGRGCRRRQRQRGALSRPLRPGLEDVLYFADCEAHTVRSIEVGGARVGGEGGAVRTLAGVAWQAGRVDGIGAAARLNCPGALAVRGGALVVAERGSDALRVVHLGMGRVDTLAGAAGAAGAEDGRGASARLYQELAAEGAW
jgi:hypothetical protein